MTKTDNAIKILEISLSKAAMPVVMSSFGKDSIVLLDMVRKFIPDIDVLYLMDTGGKMLQKHYRAFRVANKLGTPLYTYPPFLSDYVQKDGFWDAIHYFYVNGKDYLTLYNGCKPYKEGEPYLCALIDLLTMPTCDKYDFRWDCIFQGQRSDETIHIGKTTIKEPISKFGHGIMALPLHDWTEADVWEYIKTNNIPYQTARYDDKRTDVNNDHIPTCHECLDLKNEGKEIICPQRQELIKYQGISKADMNKKIETLLGKTKYLAEVV
jgi:3'-phosphoadenosine 5'-phosphosulfate sulfotransferase (PAPS reductase)/FAD synthetase